MGIGWFGWSYCIGINLIGAAIVFGLPKSMALPILLVIGICFAIPLIKGFGPIDPCE